MTRVVASEGRLSEFLKKFLSFLVVVPGHPSHGPFYLISGLLKSIQRFGGWGHSGKNNSSNNSGSGSGSSSGSSSNSTGSGNSGGGEGASEEEGAMLSWHRAAVYVDMLPLLFAYEQVSEFLSERVRQPANSSQRPLY